MMKTTFQLSFFLFTSFGSAFAPIPIASQHDKIVAATTGKLNNNNNSKVLFMSSPAVLNEPRTEEEVESHEGKSQAAAELTVAMANDVISSEVSPESVAVNDEEEMTETQKLMKQVKEAGTAGIVSYALWEVGFWALAVPVCVFGYREVTGHWPDFSNAEDMQKLGAEAFAFVNFARFAVPLRIGLALSTTPWIQQNILDRFSSNSNTDDDENEGKTGDDSISTL